MQMFWWSLVVGCSLVVNFAASLPTTTESANATAPREFPKLNQNYTFVDNSSIRENLASHSDIDTEVSDLLENKEEKEDAVVNPSEQEEDIGKKEAVEWIENGEDTEDSKFSTTTSTVTELETTTKQTTQKLVFVTTLEPYRDGIPIIDGTVAAILVGVFLVICIFGYTGLILWRRSLEMKYGSREMLVDKDEMYDPDDMRHFSI